MRIFRLFNESKGKKYLAGEGLETDFINKLNVLGISGIANILSAVKTAKYYEMNSDDVIISLATDGANLYESRLTELSSERGEYTELQAAKDFEKCIYGTQTDSMKELTYSDRKMIHNLKYFTWVEQQERSIEDLNQLWYDKTIWQNIFAQPAKWDEMIEEFNKM
jgi:hypothetical protein